MLHSEFEITTNDNLKLQGQSWKPEGETKATVCMIHGLGEHAGRYGHVAKAFNEHGIAVLAFDLRGHGRSEGKRGHAPDYDVLMSDVAQLLETAGERYPNLPVFLYGHSLGGSLVIHYALRKQPGLAGVVASSPLLRLAYRPPVWKTGLLHLMHALRVNLSLPSGVDDTALSRDLNVVRIKRNDPLSHKRITPPLATGMLRAGEWNLQHAAELPCPLLLMHGGSDRITSATASKEFASRAGILCTLKIWKGFFHELHNEPGKQEIFAVMLEWINNQTMSWKEATP